MQGIDKLNTLTTKSTVRAIPYEKYFGEMEISEEEKKKRIALANELEIIFMYLFAVIATTDLIDKSGLYLMVEDMYSKAAYDFIGSKDKSLAYLNTYIAAISVSVIDATIQYMEEDSYYLSQDRAMFIAENEANSVGNYNDMLKAIKAGCDSKKWITMKDRRVRHTHKSLDDKVVGIHDVFNVGGSYMLYPKDTTYEPDAKELVNCRCVCEYFKK